MNKILYLIFPVLIFSSSTFAYAATGKQIFEEKCSTCHELPKAKDLIGGQWSGRIDQMIEFTGVSLEDKNKLLDHIYELMDK